MVSSSSSTSSSFFVRFAFVLLSLLHVLHFTAKTATTTSSFLSLSSSSSSSSSFFVESFLLQSSSPLQRQPLNEYTDRRRYVQSFSSAFSLSLIQTSISAGRKRRTSSLVLNTTGAHNTILLSKVVDGDEDVKDTIDTSKSDDNDSQWTTDNSITALVRRMQRGEISVEKNLKETLNRIAERDSEIGAFLSVAGTKAIEEAKTMDKTNQDSEKDKMKMPLYGLPIVIKDNICTEGIATTAGSRVLEGYIPSYDATVVSKLKEAGAIIVGKANMDEFGMGSTTESSGFQVTKNPRDLSRAPGGSSGGSAAVVASGMCSAAIGTDTGGSVRQPASWCGIVGLKPTYGRVSRYGLLAYGSSTDTIGPLANNVEDAALLLQIMAGSDTSHDATSLSIEVPNWIQEIQDFTEAFLAKASKAQQANQKEIDVLKGVKIGVIQETLNTERTQPEVREALLNAIEVYKSLGAEIISDISIPYLTEHCASYYVNVLSEASANLARYDGMRYGLRDPASTTSKNAMKESRGVGLGEEVKQRIMLGTFSLSAGYSDDYYNKARDLRQQLNDDFRTAFKEVDVLIGPTAPTVAYPLGQANEKKVDSYKDDIFTVPASLSGLPAISIPTKSISNDSSNSLPIGMQLIGEKCNESIILKVARAYELMTREG